MKIEFLVYKTDGHGEFNLTGSNASILPIRIQLFIDLSVSNQVNFLCECTTLRTLQDERFE